MPAAATADAPGRVNLIGEHTDYHDGFVLPTVIPQRTRVILTRRDDRRVRARSGAVGETAEEYARGHETPGRGWLDYVQGVTAILARAGFDVGGFELEIASDVPMGAGVSSSAALEVSLLRGLRLLFDLSFDDVRLAHLARAVETDFVGAPVGIMDQMVSSLGHDGEALFIDTRSLRTERIPLPPSLELIVIDSGITHAHAGGEYKTRREESFRAAAQLGVEKLRDVDLSALPRIDRLPPVLARRARHIVTENARVLEAVEALRDGDGARLGRLFEASHQSMRDDYEITTPAIDLLAALGRAHPEVVATRMTGGGFGGSVVMLARRGRGAAAADLCAEYNRRTGNRGRVLVPIVPS